MNRRDRRLIACGTIASVTVLFKIYWLMIDAFTADMSHNISNINVTLTIILILSMIGIVWFGLIHDLIFKEKE